MFRRTFRRLVVNDPYRVLGVTKESTPFEVKRQYLKLAKIHHPDRPTGNKAKFQDIQNAYEMLKDGQSYDVPKQHTDPEAPASTNYGEYSKDNYVSGNGQLQAGLRLMVVWSFMYFFLRFVLTNIFPPKKMSEIMEEAQRKEREKQQAMQGGQGAGGEALSPETKAAVGEMFVGGGKRGDTMSAADSSSSSSATGWDVSPPPTGPNATHPSSFHSTLRHPTQGARTTEEYFAKMQQQQDQQQPSASSSSFWGGSKDKKQGEQAAATTEGGQQQQHQAGGSPSGFGMRRDFTPMEEIRQPDGKAVDPLSR